MPLSLPAERELLHTRNIVMRGYRRADGCFDIEGHLIDTKTYDRDSAGITCRAGEPVHEMWLRITVNPELVIVDAEAQSDAVPYPGQCNTITPAYRRLIGMSLRPGFAKEVRTLLGGICGCTHLTELIGSVATTAFQTLSGQTRPVPGRRPFQLDGCHALATGGEVVARYYPEWFSGEAAAEERQPGDHPS